MLPANVSRLIFWIGAQAPVPFVIGSVFQQISAGACGDDVPADDLGAADAAHDLFAGHL